MQSWFGKVWSPAKSSESDEMWMWIGLVLGGLGLILCAMAIFGGFTWFQKILYFTLGLALLTYFGMSVALYGGMSAIASLALNKATPEKGTEAWWNWSKSWLSKLFTVRLHNYQQYNLYGDKPVIFVINRVTSSYALDEYLLPIINQPHVRIVAPEQRMTHTKKAKLLTMMDYLALPQQDAMATFLHKGQETLQQQSKSLVIFPERVSSSSSMLLQPFFRGAFVLSHQTQIPIVPVVIDVETKGRSLRWGTTVDVHFLPTVYPKAWNSSNELQDHVREQMLKHLESLRRNKSLVVSLSDLLDRVKVPTVRPQDVKTKRKDEENAKNTPPPPKAVDALD